MKIRIISILLLMSMTLMSCSTTTVRKKNNEIEIHNNVRLCQIGDSIRINENIKSTIAKDSIQSIGFENRTNVWLAYLSGLTGTILLTIPVAMNQCKDEDRESGQNGACTAGVFLFTTLIGAIVVGPITAAISNGYAEDRRIINECETEPK